MEDEGVLRGLDRFDFYAGIGFSGIGGVNYYLTNNFALVFEGTYWGYAGGTIGILYKF